jgi:hypothetical protein
MQQGADVQKRAGAVVCPCPKLVDRLCMSHRWPNLHSSIAKSNADDPLVRFTILTGAVQAAYAAECARLDRAARSLSLKSQCQSWHSA